MKLDENGYTPRPDLYQFLVTEFSLNTTPEALVADFRAHFGSHTVLFPGTREVLSQLRSDGYQLGIISQRVIGGAVGEDTHQRFRQTHGDDSHLGAGRVSRSRMP